MKKLIFLGLMFSTQVFALESINCTNVTKPDHSYRFQELRSGDYQLTVKKTVEDPLSCRSRWGCESKLETVYEDILKATDYQGTMYFESKKTTVSMEYMEEVSYNYTTRLNGRYVTRSETLNCEIQ